MPWAAALTFPHCEAKAAENAADQGFATWVPRCRSGEVLFPRYILVLVEGAWRSLLSTRGVLDVLRSGEAPSFLRPAEEARLRAMEGPDGLVRMPPRFAAGEVVRLKGRLRRYQHYEFVYEGMSPRDRCRVLLRLLGREVELEFNEADLEAA